MDFFSLYLCSSIFVILSYLFLAALWSPVGERVDLMALVCDIFLCFCHFPVQCLGSGVVFLIFAFFLTLNPRFT